MAVSHYGKTIAEWEQIHFLLINGDLSLILRLDYY